MKKSTITICFLAAASAPKLAISAPAQPHEEHNTYVHMALGVVDSNPAKGLVISNTLGYDFNEYWSIEGSYNYPGFDNEREWTSTQTPGKDSVVPKLDSHGEYTAISLTPVFKYPINDDVRLLAKLGVALVNSKLSLTHTDCKSEQTKYSVKDSNIGVTGGLGAEWTFDRCESVDVYARAEYNYLSLGTIEDLNGYTGKIDHDLGDAHLFNLAVGIKF